MRAASSPSLFPASKNLTTDEVLALIVFGKQEELRKKLEHLKVSNPEELSRILNTPGDTKDFAAINLYSLTPLHLALCNLNFEVSQMLIGYLSSEDAIRQFDEIFPDGVEAKRIALENQLYDFTGIRDAIINAQPADLKKILENPRSSLEDLESSDDVFLLEPNRFERIKNYRLEISDIFSKGDVFNPYQLLAVLRIYAGYCEAYKIDLPSPDQATSFEELYKIMDVLAKRPYPASFNDMVVDDVDTDHFHLHDPNRQKRNVLWRQVVGYVQRFSPVSFMGFLFACGCQYGDRYGFDNLSKLTTFYTNGRIRLNDRHYVFNDALGYEGAVGPFPGDVRKTTKNLVGSESTRFLVKPLEIVIEFCFNQLKTLRSDLDCRAASRLGR